VLAEQRTVAPGGGACHARSVPSLSRRGLLLAGIPCLWAPRALSAEATTLVIQPLGKAATLVGPVAAALSNFYDVTVSIAPSVSLPERAYYRPRARYRAEILLEVLAELAPPGTERVLGLASVDISTSKPPHEDWGILGLASVGGQTCVLSSFRCRRRSRGAAHAVERLAKTAVHELGHTFGLDHCPNHGCLMEDGGGSVLTTDRETDLCAECRSKLAGAGKLRSGAVSPWV
jgi:archaemetzincin